MNYMNLIDWFNDHIQHPYPTENEKSNLSMLSKLRLDQVWIFVSLKI